MSLRSDLIPVVDDTRELIADLGFRLETFVVRVRTWSGAEVGRGTATDVDVTLTPPPKWKDVPTRLVFDSPGIYEAGDKLVSKISATYTESDLNPTLTGVQELIWLVNGEEWRPVARPEPKAFEWRVTLRRKNRKRA